MALGFVRTTEQETLVLSADSISLFQSTADEKLTSSAKDTFIADGPMLKTFGRDRTDSQEENASTTSGDEGYSSDDAASLSPCSASNDAASCVYSVMFLFQMRAARALATGPCNTLGYHTEPVPADALPCVSSHASRSVTKPRKAHKPAKSKRSSKASVATPAFDRLPKTPLPDSTADSWVAQQRAKAPSADDDAMVTRAARGILNKLTIEKFETLFHQLVACGIQTPTHISMLMCEIFEKATMQHQFIAMYAELCVCLEKEPRILSAVRRAGPLHSFRRLLLNQCQSVFEQLLEPGAADVAVDEGEQMCRKQRALGNIKLIGELLVQGMLSSELFLECANELLHSRSTCGEALESLAAFLMVAGPKFDTNEFQHHAKLEKLFAEMDGLTSDKSLPARLRFLVRDVLDARRAGWTTSVNQAAMKAAPMKLDDVREKAERETGVSLPVRQPASKSNSTRLGNLAAICRAPGVANDTRWKKQRPAQQPGKCSIAKLADIVSKQVADKKFGVARKAAQEAATEVGDSSIALSVASQTEEHFDLVTFRKALAATLAKLAQDKNVPAAVQYIRLQQVPLEHQADQFVDVLSRIVEERRGAVRRCMFAFAGSLVGAEESAFDRKAGLDGIALFFQDVYTEMCSEVPRLPSIMKSELVPMMYSVLPASELDELLPEELRTA